MKTITREEAIQILSTRDAHGVLCGYTSGVTEALDMAIEALSRSGDLISRANAMSKCKSAEKELTDEAERKGLRVARFIIGELPSADAEWIPCSERLPSESGNYLITVADLRLGHNGEHTVTMADFYVKAKKWNSVVDVVAWMPLPMPYREDGEA